MPVEVRSSEGLGLTARVTMGRHCLTFATLPCRTKLAELAWFLSAGRRGHAKLTLLLPKPVVRAFGRTGVVTVFRVWSVSATQHEPNKPENASHEHKKSYAEHGSKHQTVAVLRLRASLCCGEAKHHGKKDCCM